MKAERNKTIDLSVEEGRVYLEKCITISENASLNDIINKTINGDTFEVLDLLPHNFIDLLIADPPYNLDKEFGTGKFKKMTDEDYYVYTETWIKKVLPLLKDNASIYVCCDWNSSMVMGQVLKKYFHIIGKTEWKIFGLQLKQKIIHLTLKMLKCVVR